MSCEIVFLHNFYPIFVFSVVLQTTPSTSRPSDTIFCCDPCIAGPCQKIHDTFDTFDPAFSVDDRSFIPSALVASTTAHRNYIPTTLRSKAYLTADAGIVLLAHSHQAILITAIRLYLSCLHTILFNPLIPSIQPVTPQVADPLTD